MRSSENPMLEREISDAEILQRVKKWRGAMDAQVGTYALAIDHRNDAGEDAGGGVECSFNQRDLAEEAAEYVNKQSRIVGGGKHRFFAQVRERDEEEKAEIRA